MLGDLRIIPSRDVGRRDTHAICRIAMHDGSVQLGVSFERDGHIDIDETACIACVMFNHGELCAFGNINANTDMATVQAFNNERVQRA